MSCYEYFLKVGRLTARGIYKLDLKRNLLLNGGKIISKNWTDLGEILPELILFPVNGIE